MVRGGHQASSSGRPCFARSARNTASAVSGKLGQSHADRIVDGIGDRGRNAEGSELADAFGAERAVALTPSTVSFIHRRHVVDARNFVVGKRGIGDLPAVEIHLLEHGEAELHQRGAGKLRLHDLRIDWTAGVGDVDQAQ